MGPIDPSKIRSLFRASALRVLDKILGCWWHSGSARVSHHNDHGTVLAECGYLIKIILVTCEKGVVQFLPSIASFLRVLQFRLVVTMDPRGVALTGPLARTTYVADRVVQYK